MSEEGKRVLEKREQAGGGSRGVKNGKLGDRLEGRI